MCHEEQTSANTPALCYMGGTVGRIGAEVVKLNADLLVAKG